MAKKIAKKSSKNIKSVKAEIVDEENLSLPAEPDVNELQDLNEHVEVLEKDEQSASREVAPLDPVSRYMNEVRKYPLLTKEQEIEISQKYFETKDPKLAQILVTSNLRFVVKIAAEYSKFGARLIDLIQEGNMGLMHGVKDFNPYKGVRLITYAVWWIRGIHPGISHETVFAGKNWNYSQPEKTFLSTAKTKTEFRTNCRWQSHERNQHGAWNPRI